MSLTNDGSGLAAPLSGSEPPRLVCARDKQEHTPGSTVDEQQEARQVKGALVVVLRVWSHRHRRRASAALDDPTIPQVERSERFAQADRRETAHATLRRLADPRHRDSD